MQNYGMGLRPCFKIISEGNTTILHSAFSIMHSFIRPQNYNFLPQKHYRAEWTGNDTRRTAHALAAGLAR